MANDKYYSFLMGINGITELKENSFDVKEDGKYYRVSFSKENREKFEEFIMKHLQNGYWNEYVGNEIVFIFKFKDSTIQRFVLDESNNDTILNLCCEFANTNFASIKDMLLDNDFYKENIKF